MLKTIVYIVALVVVVAAATWFADQPGGITLEWLGYKIQTDNVGVLVVAVLVLAILSALAYRLWLALRRAPGQYVESRRAARQEKGYKALTQGMVAVAAGDAAEAQRQAKRADNLLGDPPLTMLLSAQAAQLNGDEDAARNYFTAMLDDPETAFLGLRGLLIQSQREDDPRAALTYAQRAYELRPKTPWVLTTLFDLQVTERQWTRALASLEDAARIKALDAEEIRRRRLVVLLGCSGEAEEAGDAREALSYARKAYQLAPDFIPAILTMVRLMIGEGKNRPASRIIHNAWGRDPHPALARIYGEMGGDEGPLKKVRRMERLLSFNPEHLESHIAVAEAALEAELWGIARTHLEKAAGETPVARVCRLMAELEEGEHGDIAAARPWLLRAANADPDPAWVCADCGAVWATWTPLCGKCGSLGSLSWAAPERARDLLTGAPPEAAKETLPARAEDPDKVLPAPAETAPQEPDGTTAQLPAEPSEADPAPTGTARH